MPPCHSPRVRDNPVPLEFPISFIGAKPTAQVTLADAAPDQPLAPAPSAGRISIDGGAAAAGGKHGGGRLGGRGGGRDSVLAAAEHMIQFER